MRLILLLLLLSFWKPAEAQRSFFVYLESEGGLPFYVKMEERIISSTAPGYLILPEMADSTYQLQIGFSNGRRAAKFSISLEARDRGLVLRNENGVLQLFDLQTTAPLAAVPDPFSDVSYTVRNDPFTVLLARAAHDSDILYVPVAQPAVVKSNPEPVQPKPEVVQAPASDSSKTDATALLPPQKDASAATLTDSAAVVRTPAQLLPDSQATASRPTADSLARVPAADSTAVVYNPPVKTDTAMISDTALRVPAAAQTDSVAIRTNPVADSVALTRPEAPPADTAVAITKPLADTAAAAPPEYRRTLVRKYAESSTSEGFGLVFIDQGPEGADTIRLLIPNPPFNLGAPDTVKKDDPVLFLEVRKDTVQPQAVPAALKLTRPKVECRDQAGDSDFFRLRKSMAARETEEAMIDDARKYFRRMCFSTEQVRNLSVLFLTAAGKYAFFDAAYLHVSDQEQFASLESEIRDPYYVKRFKALIGE